MTGRRFDVSFDNSSSRSTHQQCFNFRINRNSTLWVQLESGGENDCVEDTDWHYGRFDIFLYGPTSPMPHADE